MPTTTPLAAPAAYVTFTPAPTEGRARIRFEHVDDENSPYALLIRWAHTSGAESEALLSHRELAYLAGSAFGDLIADLRAANNTPATVTRLVSA